MTRSGNAQELNFLLLLMAFFSQPVRKVERALREREQQRTIYLLSGCL